MKMTRETRDDVLVLRLSGQLMGGPDADAVREAIQEALRQGGRKILFDLGELTWVNSTGLGINNHVIFVGYIPWCLAWAR